VDTTGLTRRQLLSSGGVMLGYVVLSRNLPPRTPLPEDSEKVVAGVVENVESPRILKVRSFRKKPVSIQFSDDATFWRGRSGRVAGLDAFIPGDEVVAEGQLVADGFAATTLMSLYRAIEGRIVQQQGNNLQTSSGAVRLTPDTTLLRGDGFVSKSLDELAVGDYIVGDAWHDPLTDDLIVMRIGAREAGV